MTRMAAETLLDLSGVRIVIFCLLTVAPAAGDIPHSFLIPRCPSEKNINMRTAPLTPSSLSIQLLPWCHPCALFMSAMVSSICRQSWNALQIIIKNYNYWVPIKSNIKSIQDWATWLSLTFRLVEASAESDGDDENDVDSDEDVTCNFVRTCLLACRKSGTADVVLDAISCGSCFITLLNCFLALERSTTHRSVKVCLCRRCSDYDSLAPVSMLKSLHEFFYWNTCSLEWSGFIFIISHSQWWRIEHFNVKWKSIRYSDHERLCARENKNFPYHILLFSSWCMTTWTVGREPEVMHFVCFLAFLFHCESYK